MSKVVYNSVKLINNMSEVSLQTNFAYSRGGFILEEMTGWYDLPSLRMSTEARAYSDGLVFGDRQYLDGRFLNFSIVCDISNLYRLKRVLIGEMVVEVDDIYRGESLRARGVVAEGSTEFEALSMGKVRTTFVVACQPLLEYIDKPLNSYEIWPRWEGPIPLPQEDGGILAPLGGTFEDVIESDEFPSKISIEAPSGLLINTTEALVPCVITIHLDLLTPQSISELTRTEIVNTTGGRWESFWIESLWDVSPVPSATVWNMVIDTGAPSLSVEVEPRSPGVTYDWGGVLPRLYPGLNHMEFHHSHIDNINIETSTVKIEWQAGVL